MAVTQQTANEIFENHPTRFKKKEKESMRAELRTKLKEIGYSDSEITEVKASGTNLVAGNPHAEYIFTAHYDTPGRTGWMLGTSKWFGMTGANIFLLALMPILVFIGAALPELIVNNFNLNVDQEAVYGLNFLAGYIVLLVFMAVLIISMVIKNKNNRNDNTSGVLSLLALAEKVAADDELRGKCCFVFFDNEEWGLLGSAGFSNYCKKNGIDLKQSKVINFDCVGYGDVLTFVSTKSNPVAKSVTAAFEQAGQKPVYKRSRMIFLSDHANFKNSVMVSYTKHSLTGLLYLPLIHTSKDVECDIGQINRLTDNFYTFIRQGKI